MFFNIIFNDIVPIFVVMALGYAGAKMNAFTPSQTQALNKVVLNFALPAALFVSITKATREMLFEDLTLTLVSLIGSSSFAIGFAERSSITQLPKPQSAV